MASKLVLITGGTGMIGFRTVVEALQAGYRVRVAVRKPDGFEQIKAAKSILPFSSSVESIIVPDILPTGAYDEAVKDVDYIIHLAAPLSLGKTDFEKDIIEPTIKGTLGILHSAIKEPKIKRVVITSSIVGSIPFNKLVGLQDDVFDETSFAPYSEGPFVSSFQAYSASKARALLAIDSFVAEQKPTFDINTIHPSFVIGRSELVTDPEKITVGTNGLVMRAVLGIKNVAPMPGTSVHLNDVAKLHVQALDPKIPGGQRFMANSQSPQGTRWEDLKEILEKRFPDDVAKGLVKLDGVTISKPLYVDASYTEKTFSFKFQNYEEQVVSVVEHYLELLASQ